MRDGPPTNGTDTSGEAADLFSRAETLRNKIFAYIKGRDGATCDECEVFLGERHETVSARIWELRGNPLLSDNPMRIVDSGLRRPTRRGRNAKVYVALEEKV